MRVRGVHGGSSRQEGEGGGRGGRKVERSWRGWRGWAGAGLLAPAATPSATVLHGFFLSVVDGLQFFPPLLGAEVACLLTAVFPSPFLQGRRPRHHGALFSRSFKTVFLVNPLPSAGTVAHMPQRRSFSEPVSFILDRPVRPAPRGSCPAGAAGAPVQLWFLWWTWRVAKQQTNKRGRGAHMRWTGHQPANHFRNRVSCVPAPRPHIFLHGFFFLVLKRAQAGAAASASGARSRMLKAFGSGTKCPWSPSVRRTWRDLACPAEGAARVGQILVGHGARLQACKCLPACPRCSRAPLVRQRHIRRGRWQEVRPGRLLHVTGCVSPAETLGSVHQRPRGTYLDSCGARACPDPMLLSAALVSAGRRHRRGAARCRPGCAAPT